MTEKRFTTVYDEQSKMMQYVDTQKEERWAIWNANKTLQIMNELVKENEQLKQRNNNQYNQLNQLWQLIQAKDWETLTAMDNQMKEDDKRLRNEWKCYE